MCGHRRDAEVVQDEQVQPRQLRQPFAQAAIAVGQVQLLQQPRRAACCPSAQASHVLPHPVAPVSSTLWPWRSQSPPARLVMTSRLRPRLARQSMSSRQALETFRRAAFNRRSRRLLSRQSISRCISSARRCSKGSSLAVMWVLKAPACSSCSVCRSLLMVTLGVGIAGSGQKTGQRMPRSGHSEHPAGVRYQHGIVSAIAWNTQA